MMSFMEKKTTQVRTFFIIMALLVFSLAFQGSRGLWERDEGRYTNIAMRMLQSGDFIVPAFNDDVPHFAKPPLTYWSIAGGVSLLGWNEWGARLPNALAFVGTILVIYAMARRIVPDRAWLPPLIYATCIVPFCAANVITTDTLLTLWEAIAVLGFIEWWHRREDSGMSRLPLNLLMWSGFGLAFLTKGPPGLLPLIAIMVFVGIKDGLKAIIRLFSFSGILVFVIVGFWWYVLVAITHPGIMKYFIRDEFVNRIATGMHHRNPEWYKPFVIYIPVLIIGTVPWTLPLIRAIRSFQFTLVSRSWWKDKLEHNQWPAFLVLWVALPLAVFFLSSSRLPLYVLPLFVPLSLATGRLTRFTPNSKTAVCLLAAWIVMLPAVKFAGSLYPFEKDSRKMARMIADKVHPIPREIVFVDSEPFWGLNLYLHSEVERVSISTPGTGGTLADELLFAELVEGETGILIVAEKRKEARVLAGCRQIGYEARTLGGYGKWVLIDPYQGFGKPPGS